MDAVVSRTGKVSGRRARILDAAHACFVRQGFHRASMNDIAGEAAMSAGNLYRYFASKEALIAGLVEREVERCRAVGDDIRDAGEDRAQGPGALDRHCLPMSRDEAVMRVEIWAEASRNPAVAALLRTAEKVLHARFLETCIESASSPDREPAALLAGVAPLLDGIVVAIATMPDYDPEPAIEHIRALLGASPDRRSSDAGSKNAVCKGSMLGASCLTNVSAEDPTHNHVEWI